MLIDPESPGFPNVYKVMVGSIVPRPIAFVSTISPEGIYNLSPFSFFTGGQRESANGMLLPDTQYGRLAERHARRTRLDGTGSVCNSTIIRN